jgi:hypothetical protein
VAATIVAALGSSIGCARDAAVESSDQHLIGGVEAPGIELDAVGALREDDGEGPATFCTGTLVSPSTVLSAKHCSWGGGRGRVSFSIGFDASKPRRAVDVVAKVASPVNRDGIGAKTSDVSLYLLAEPILDVKPLRLSPSVLSTTDVGREFTAVGYGRVAGFGRRGSLR